VPLKQGGESCFIVAFNKPRKQLVVGRPACRRRANEFSDMLKDSL
jgi:hypothetical protein